MTAPGPTPPIDPPARAAALFHVVLHQPLIPNNTGNIGRTCVATGCALHLVHPLGFDTSEKACRRAGLDYWPRLDVRHHASWEVFLGTESLDPRRLWVFTTRTTRCVYDAGFRPGDYLVFGNEGGGLPQSLIEAHSDRALRFPMVIGERSLNVATAVCAAVFEAVRQTAAAGTVTIGPDGTLGQPPAGENSPANPRSASNVEPAGRQVRPDT